MSKRWLGLLNSVYSGRPTVGVGAFLGMVVVAWGPIREVTTSLGIFPVGVQKLAGDVALSSLLPLVTFFLLRPLRWAFIYKSLRDEIRWFKSIEPQVIVAVGPGGAIIAGMVVKLLAELEGRVRISAMSISDFGPKRSRVSDQGDQRFRSKPITS